MLMNTYQPIRHQSPSDLSVNLRLQQLIARL